MLATYMRRMRNNNLEIRVAGSSCRQELAKKSFLHVMYDNPLVAANLQVTISRVKNTNN